MNSHDGKDNWTALHWAASIGATDACRVLLSRGMSTSARTKNQSREPLFLAVKGGHLETVRVLCQANCNVNAGSKIDGATALHRAALQGHDEIITLLIEYGADVNQVDIEGMRPAMWAVQAKRNATVAHLVASGADLEAKSAAGLTLLHRAVSSRNVDMVRLLLSLGSDVNAPAPFGNALNRADATGNGEMISLLSEHGAVREVRTDARGAPLQFTGSYAHGHLD
jgi:ankyrin repeat protein